LTEPQAASIQSVWLVGVSVATYYQELGLKLLRLKVRKDLLAESKKHQVWKRLRQTPSIGPIRTAVLLGIMQTAHRFRAAIY
jgi:hypothetical protein